MLEYQFNGGYHCLTTQGSYHRGFNSQQEVEEEIALAMTPLPSTLVMIFGDSVPTGYEDAVAVGSIRRSMGYLTLTKCLVDGKEVTPQPDGTVHPRLRVSPNCVQGVKIEVLHTYGSENWKWASPNSLEVGDYSGLSELRITFPRSARSFRDFAIKAVKAG